MITRRATGLGDTPVSYYTTPTDAQQEYLKSIGRSWVVVPVPKEYDVNSAGEVTNIKPPASYVPTYVEPTIQSCGPTDFACIQAQQTKRADAASAYNAQWAALSYLNALAQGAATNWSALTSQAQSYVRQMQTSGTAPTATTTPAAPVQVSNGSGSTFRLENVTRNSTNYQVGDSWRVTITRAAPNQPVFVAGTQNGKSVGQTQVGKTDGQGNFTLSGVMTPDTIGQWYETWMVGNTALPAAQFTVSQPPGPSGTQSTTPVNPSSTTPQTALTLPSIDGVDLNGAATVAGYQIPYWAMGAAAIGLLLVLGRH